VVLSFVFSFFFFLAWAAREPLVSLVDIPRTHGRPRVPFEKKTRSLHWKCEPLRVRRFGHRSAWFFSHPGFFPFTMNLWFFDILPFCAGSRPLSLNAALPPQTWAPGGFPSEFLMNLGVPSSNAMPVRLHFHSENFPGTPPPHRSPIVDFPRASALLLPERPLFYVLSACSFCVFFVFHRPESDSPLY